LAPHPSELSLQPTLAFFNLSKTGGAQDVCECAVAASGEKFPVECAQKRAENLWRRNSSPLGVRNRSRPAASMQKESRLPVQVYSTWE